jgi:Cu+-exporting ATPase
MHREISYGDDQFEQENTLSLYLLTTLVGLLIVLDLWPYLAGWLNSFGLGLPSWPNSFNGYRIALLAAILGGARALYGSIDSLLQGKWGADLALALATIAAILLQEPLVAAEIVFIGMVGECLESVTFARTQSAIRKLAEVFPHRCWRLRDGQEERILVSELAVGDVVVVKPGGRIPCDGEVRDGRSSVDTSALTGESLPVDRGPGDEVFAGSLNQTGALTIVARRVAEHTVAGQVVEWTSRALKDKAPLERTADRMARWFLPMVLGVALATFLIGVLGVWGGWTRPAGGTRFSLMQAVRVAAYPALAVLVVACPCALILATPATVIAALGRLAGTGILIKSGAALERLATVNAFCFDKTGTLTEGKLELGRVAVLDESSEDDALRWAAAAEQRSEHLLGELLVAEAKRRNLELPAVERFQAYPGLGVLAVVGDATVLVGNRRLLEELGVAIPEPARRTLEELDAAGQTAILFARGSVAPLSSPEQIQTQPGSGPASEPAPGIPTDLRVVAVLGVRDRVREEAADVLTELRGLGIGHIAMLTGDRQAVARTVADTLGLAEVHAELLPTRKAELVSEWEGEGRRVAMVGDGINDAPALARATVGLAIGGTGTDIAAEAGDVVFMGDPLKNLPLLVRLSREVVKIIHQNILWFAIVTNLVGVVLTAWLWPLFAPAGWYEQSPLVAVVYHQLGSLAVLLNAMRLLWFDRPQSRTYSAFRRWLAGVNDWTEKHLNIEEGLHWLTHRWRTVVTTLAILLLLVYPLWGLTQIESDEIGVVQRFGAPVRDLSPGLHWCWPWPIESVRRVQPDRIRAVPVGYRVDKPDARLVGGRSWSSGHAGEGIRRIPDEAVMITGDGDLIEVQAAVRYRITAPRVYLFEVADPEAIVRGCTEAVFRELIASRSFEALLTTSRVEFEAQSLARLEQRLRDFGPDGLGLHIEGLVVHDLHPPPEVVGAYHRVAVAMERADRRVNDAEAARTRNLADQYGRSLSTVSQAEVQSYEKERLARARQWAFFARDRSRSTLPWATELDLFLGMGVLVGEGQKPEAVKVWYERMRTLRLEQQAYLIEFRLLSEGLTSALAPREKVIVDDLALPGWLQLWLMLGDQRRSLLPGGESFDFSGRRPMQPTTPRRDEP